MSQINLHQAAQNIAHILNFTVPSNQDTTFDIKIIGPNQERLYIGNDRKPGRLHISCDYPDPSVKWSNFVSYIPGTAQRKSFPEITCAHKRGPIAIAKDIKRRILPQYHQLVAEIKQNINQHNQKRTKMLKDLHRIANAFHTTFNAKHERITVSFGSTHHNQNHNLPYGTASNYHNGRLTLNLQDLTTAETITIAQLLHQLRTDPPPPLNSTILLTLT